MSTSVVAERGSTTIVVEERKPHVIVRPTPVALKVTSKQSQSLQMQAKPHVAELITAGPAGPVGPQGPVGPAGGNVLAMPASVALSGHRVVRTIGDGTVGYATNTDPLHGDDVLGITIGAASAGAPANIQVAGELTEPSWNWVPNEPVFLGANGAMTQDPPEPPDATFQLSIGFASTPTSLVIRVEQPLFFED